MAHARSLRNPPIREAVLQFEFPGVSLGRSELETLAAPYLEKGWNKEEAHSIEATLGSRPEGAFEVVSTDAIFAGLILRHPEGRHLVHLRASQFAVSNAQHYESWEALEGRARVVFNHYVSVSQAQLVGRVSARFINRIPAFEEFADFDAMLMRPPLPIADLPGATVTDFLRRHVVAGLDGGFTANLTIGTVIREPGEAESGKALVIDTDVFKSLDVEPVFDSLTDELARLRSIKNALFFGSLTEAVVEKFA